MHSTTTITAINSHAMMHNSFNEKFLERLSEVKPKKSVLANELSAMLNMEPVSVYRRLRGDVKFTADEIGVIAHRYKISLDNILGYSGVANSIKMRSELPIIKTDGSLSLNYVVERLPMLEKFISTPGCQIGGIVNALPRVFTNEYPGLMRFMLFKWAHYGSDKAQYRNFETTLIPDNIIAASLAENKMIKQIENTFFIWNERVLHNTVADIKYFQSIELIKPEDIQRLKENLVDMLDYFYICTKHSAFPETGKKFSLYLSSINIDSSILYTMSENKPGILIYGDSMEIYPASEQDRHSFDIIVSWIEALKNGTVQISNTNERERILFFKRQREVLENL